MRVLVCGGRDFQDEERLHHVLDQLDGEDRPIRVVRRGTWRGPARLPLGHPPGLVAISRCRARATRTWWWPFREGGAPPT